MIARSITTAVCAVAIAAAALLVPPAEAREKKAYRYDNDRYVGQLTSGQRAQGRVDPLSLDGRVLGFTRTCWWDQQRYDPYGVPIGPYCH
jgi:hypothetical protein